MLIGAEGGEDSSKMLSHFLRAWADSRMQIQSPAGVRGRGDPTGANAPRRLPGTPAESEAAWSGNQYSRLTQPFYKTQCWIATSATNPGTPRNPETAEVAKLIGT